MTRRAYEQASSEPCAEYKASQIQGESLLNLCGGLGVDDTAFATSFQSIWSVELDASLHEMAVENDQRFHLETVHRIQGDSMEFLANSERNYDWIYADPDRREGQARLVSLEDCQPSLLQNWERIQARSTSQLIKLSPLYSLDKLEQELPGLYRIDVVAIKGEVKEVLAFCHSAGYPSSPERRAIELEPYQHYAGFPEKLESTPLNSPYFYEAHASLAKTDLAGTYVREIGGQPLIPNALYIQSDQPLPSFFGRGFIIESEGPYNRKKFDAYLKEQGITKANLSCRFFRLSPPELKKQHRLQDGGEHYFFFFENREKKPVFIHGKKLADIG
ncbi:MAG: class I SAM-dependent methyltransferase [Bacteroidota bacterium]|nr:class I SAM-dependent methyltransferase [Bacteroidota bacterium]MDX5431830.1 class I SAM-dependent methyltransferase [Bacteroidota bacterium]MDX5470543.1 class I SAM-dependent methyltransferase [Bacteroidota bacterium]